MPIRLGQLRAFVAVAETGSVTKAGKLLFRAQSAITRSVHELERELEVDLFERRAKGMLPTDYGAALLKRARRAANELALARRDFSQRAGANAHGRSAPVFSMQVHEQRLQAFVALAQTHHMPTVARQLGISQPAVSASIRDLESSLGVALFERTARGMLPTVHGEVLALRVRRALAEIRIARGEIDAMRGIAIGNVTVGASPLGRALILPRAIARLLPAHPGLHVVTVEGPFDIMAAALRAGDLDFLFGALRSKAAATDLTGEPLFTDELAVIARAGHPLCARRRPRLDAIARTRWILPHRGSPTRDLIERMFANRGIAPPETVVETTDLAVVRGMLHESDVITAISPQQFDRELRTGTLVQLALRLPETSRVIGITQRTDSHPSPAALALMGAIRAYCEDFGR